MLHFDGAPVWHASFALIPPKPVTSWTPLERKSARKQIYKLLGAAGDPRTDKWEWGNRALHCRRQATFGERSIANLERLGEPGVAL